MSFPPTPLRFRRSRVFALMALAAMAITVPAVSAVAAPTDAATPIQITEIHYKSAPKQVELHGEPGASLAGWELWTTNVTGTWNNGYANSRIVFGADDVFNSDGYFTTTKLALGANDSGTTANPDGRAGVALVEPCADSATSTPKGTNCVVDEYLTWEKYPVTMTIGSQAGMQVSTPVGLTQVDSSQSLQRKADDTWILATPTWGAATGTEPPPPPAPGEVTPIGEIQGIDADPAVAPGTAVTIDGIVTADFKTGGFNAVIVQDLGDSNDATPDGIYVYLGANAETRYPNLTVGTQAKITGTVGTYSQQTQISATAAELVTSPTLTMPAPAQLTLPLSDADRMRYKNMLVEPTGTYTVADVYSLNNYGEIVLTAGTTPARIPTDVAPANSPEALAQATANANARILLDDGRSANISGKVPPYLATTPVRSGDQVNTFGPLVLLRTQAGASNPVEWRLEPTNPIGSGAETTTFTATNPRPAKPNDVGGTVKISSFNVLNYFTTTADQDSDSRGADNQAALAIQQSKIVSAINTLGADVVGLEEIENSVKFPPKERDSALATLVDALNNAAGANIWAYVQSPNADKLPSLSAQDFIRTAFIYKPAVISPVGDSQVYLGSEFINARQPLAQTFSHDGEQFTMIVNHFKSKGGTDEDAGDGQGAWNTTRTKQANALVDWVHTQQGAGVMSDKVALVGDFNAYSKEDPVRAITGAGYTDLGPRSGKSTYVFGGEVGSLDHVFASPALVGSVTGVDEWQINSGESYAYQYSSGTALVDATSPYRSSDHDPIVVGLQLGQAPTPPPVTPTDPSGGNTPGSGGASGNMAGTGAVVWPLLALAAVIVVIGIVLVVARRRKGPGAGASNDRP